MATRNTATPAKADPEGLEAGGHVGLVHGHADYPSDEDLANRLAAAAGTSTTVPEPLPYPDPAQQ